ncbi:uncharacterized protein LOC131284914 [Anopheles ziemanni]|uniref:uncharacterized protein LOC131262317 n=1 Tax=Anopheles coustani TaxID=139045 RepID=UPI00265877FB|nr:uncharacterized protein LOC131262317 [Anopheles coustani]XP_058169756.1 uncharacterized protein LOC131284914 [Anopheles ziemanni]
MAAAALSSLMASTSQFTQFQNTLNFVSGGAIVAGGAASSTSSHVSTASVGSTRSGGAGDAGSSTNTNHGAAGSGSDSTGSCTTIDGNDEVANTFDSTLAALAATTAASGSSTSNNQAQAGRLANDPSNEGHRKHRSHPADLSGILIGANLLDGDRRTADSASNSGPQHGLLASDDATVSVVDDEV